MTDSRRRNIVLIGYRGSGKTTVGRVLARLTSVPFVDTDELVAGEAGKSIADVFREEGESAFRRRESDVIARVSAGGPSVIGVGGGAVESAENMRRLKQGGRLVWLTCPAPVLHARIVSDTASNATRPDLTHDGGLEEVTQVLARRTPLYQSWGDVQFDSEHRAPEDIAADIEAWTRLV